MTLISVILGLIIDRFLGTWQRKRRFEWLREFSERVRHAGGSTHDSALGVLLTLVPPLIVVGILQNAWHEGAGAWLGVMLYIVVFVYCLGPRDLDADADDYQAASNSEDPALARRAAAALLGDAIPDDDAMRHRAAINAVLTQANTRIFGVLFWFWLLGPMGALLYRGTVVLTQAADDNGGYAGAISQLRWILDWPSARLLAMSYALTGHFDGALHAWRERAEVRAERVPDEAQGILVAAGNGALDQSFDEPGEVESVGAAMGLVWRALLVWLVIIALLELAGWSA